MVEMIRKGKREPWCIITNGSSGLNHAWRATMENHTYYKPGSVPRQLRRATEHGVEPDPPPRESGNGGGGDESAVFTTEWQEYGGFRVRMVYHPGPPSPQRKAFFRKLVFGTPTVSK